MGYLDPNTNTFTAATPGLTMEVDHIFPVAKIAKLDGFNKLTREQMTAIIQDTMDLGNLQPLPKSLNASKGSRIGIEWEVAKGGPLDPVYVANLREYQSTMRALIETQIAAYRRANRAGAL